MSHTYAEEESPQRIVKTRSLDTEGCGTHIVPGD